MDLLYRKNITFLKCILFINFDTAKMNGNG